MFKATPIHIRNLALEQISAYSLDTLMNSKKYVMLGEQPDGIIIETESRDVVYAKGNFQEKGISMT